LEVHFACEGVALAEVGLFLGGYAFGQQFVAVLLFVDAFCVLL
jgi:hypothetical protein